MARMAHPGVECFACQAVRPHVHCSSQLAVLLLWGWDKKRKNLSFARDGHSWEDPNWPLALLAGREGPLSLGAGRRELANALGEALGGTGWRMARVEGGAQGHQESILRLAGLWIAWF